MGEAGGRGGIGGGCGRETIRETKLRSENTSLLLAGGLSLRISQTGATRQLEAPMQDEMGGVGEIGQKKKKAPFTPPPPPTFTLLLRPEVVPGGCCFVL